MLGEDGATLVATRGRGVIADEPVGAGCGATLSTRCSRPSRVRSASCAPNWLLVRRRIACVSGARCSSSSRRRWPGWCTTTFCARVRGILDDEDLREWLGRHGASEETFARSPVLRGLYDLTFAYREGDKRRPSLAAGKGLQSLLLMINYEGSFMWRMRAGMGDVVFSPMYLALRRRGVRFEFFTRVTHLRLMPGRPAVDGSSSP